MSTYDNSAFVDLYQSMSPDGALVQGTLDVVKTVTKAAEKMGVVQSRGRETFVSHQVKTAYSDVTAIVSTAYHCTDRIEDLIGHGRQSIKEMQNPDLESGIFVRKFRGMLVKMQRSLKCAEDCLHSLKAGCDLASSSCTAAATICMQTVQEREKKYQQTFRGWLKKAAIVGAATAVVTGVVVGAFVTGGIGLVFAGLGAPGGAAAFAGIVGGTVVGTGTAVLMLAPVAVLLTVAKAFADICILFASVIAATIKLGHALFEFGKILLRAIKELDMATRRFISFIRTKILPLLGSNSSSSYEITAECRERVKKAQLCRCNAVFILITQ